MIRGAEKRHLRVAGRLVTKMAGKGLLLDKSKMRWVSLQKQLGLPGIKML